MRDRRGDDVIGSDLRYRGLCWHVYTVSRETHARRSIIRVQLYRLRDQLTKLAVRGPRASMAVRPRTQNQVKGRRIGPRVIELPPAFDLCDIGGEGACDPTGDSLLKFKNFGELAIETIGPHHRAAS